MTQPDLWRFSARELGKMLTRGDISAAALLESCLRQIDRLNPAVNAVVTLDVDGAREAARRADQRRHRGERLGPLDGLPVTIKDNIFVGGMRTTWGSLLYEDFIPSDDDNSVARLRAAGAVIVGKTNTPELALSAVTDNRIFGPTRNPWNLQLTPGGSSGGAVAAVATGMAPLALATDAGGSIRRPCAYAGTVGLKPSNGRIPKIGGFPRTAFDFQCVGPIARSVDDVAMMFDVIAGRAEHRDPPPGVRLRIRSVLRLPGQPIDPAVVESVTRVAVRLAGLGHEVEEGPLPVDLVEVDELWSVFTTAGVAHAVVQHDGWMDRVGDGIRNMAQAGQTLSASAYVRALERLVSLRARMAEAMAEIDLLLLPCSPALPWIIGDPFPKLIGGETAGPRAAAAFVTFVNATGQPAIALPADPTPDGLPVGFQLVGRAGADELLLVVAKEYESAHPFSDRWPTLRGPNGDMAV
ncbi:MAG: amidase [Pseudomonadota bacterium]